MVEQVRGSAKPRQVQAGPYHPMDCPTEGDPQRQQGTAAQLPGTEGARHRGYGLDPSFHKLDGRADVEAVPGHSGCQSELRG